MRLSARIKDLLRVFNVNYTDNQRTLTGVCPIHSESNNENALLINLEHGTFKCFTRGCHKVFKPSIIGLIRGLLSRQKGWEGDNDKNKVVSFPKTLEFATKFLGENFQHHSVEYSEEEREFAAYNRVVAVGQTAKSPFQFTRQEVRENLLIPSPYYVGRGYSEEILDKYSVGDCQKKGKPYSGRAVIPIFHDNLAVGFSGRSLYEKCDICKAYHSNLVLCPSPDYRKAYTKWKVQSEFGLVKANYLYNFDNAKSFIEEENTAIILESPGDVLKAEMAGFHNSVGLLGCYISPQQLNLLNSVGALNLIVCLNQDEAGRKGSAALLEMVSATHNVCFLSLKNKNDLGEMGVAEIKELFRNHNGRSNNYN